MNKAITNIDNEDADLMIEELKKQLQQKRQQSLLAFTKATMPTFAPADFHKQYYSILTRFADNEFGKLMVFMPPQHGKALQVNTPVLTTRGWKTHGELKPGDFVFGEDGTPKMVKWNSGIYKHPTQIVYFADGFRLCAAREHEWIVYADRDNHKGRQREIIETQNIFGKRNRRKPAIKADAIIQMPTANLPIEPYLLGVWLGDGNSKDKWVCCGAKDLEYLQPYIIEQKPSSTAFMVHLRGLETRELRSLGVLYNKHIPKRYLLSSVEQRKQLLIGLMDTDGFVDKRGRCEFCQKEGILADDVYILIRSLGYKATKHTYPATLNGNICGNKVRISFSPDKNDKIFTIERKQNRLDEKKVGDRADKTNFFINSIEDDCERWVNCIEVEGGIYLAGEQLVPTHNSEGSTRRLPAFLLGRNPDTRVAIVSYSAPKARKFNREIQRIIDSDEYRAIFPDTRLNAKNITTVAGSWLRNADECEIVGHRGGFKTVGVGGPLTGEPVDVLIMDDIYKDAKTAWSATVRESIEDWYDTVGETRLHNESRQLIVFTRWHEEDLAGKLLERQGVYGPDNPDGWVVVSFPAIKVGPPTEFDNREDGAALWPERHSLEKLKSIEKGNPQVFASLYQQNPKPFEGLMYNNFRTYDVLPIESGKMKNYTDTADTGEDWLCSICYYETATACYITDVLYTKKPMEYTESETARMLVANNVSEAVIESNNGGRGFMRNVESNVRKIGDFRMRFIGKTQHLNKEVRIFSHSAELQNILHFPTNWERRFPEFAHDLKSYRKEGKNAHDDCADAATGIVEEFTTKPRAKGITIRN